MAFACGGKRPSVSPFIEMIYLFVWISMVKPLPVGPGVDNSMTLLVAGDVTLDMTRKTTTTTTMMMSTNHPLLAADVRESTSRGTNGVDTGRDPWEINQGLCPPPLAHLCRVSAPSSTGRTQAAYVTPFFEGDIVLGWRERLQLGLANMRSEARRTRRGLRHRTGARPNLRSKRAIVRGDDLRWPNAIIPYTIDADFNREAVKRIKSALKHWQQNTCIKFVPKDDSHEDYLRFAYFPGCWSFIGRQGGEQVISMGSGCNIFGTIVHEVGHAIGFWHEQGRRDRDNFVQILHKNIASGTDENFGKIDAINVTSLGYPYDFDSVMHYSATAFSANGKPTIRMKKKYRLLLPEVSERMGRLSDGVSELDVAQTKGMYACNEKAARKLRKKPCLESEAGDGREYRGEIDFTESSITCQKWTSQYPHHHDYQPDDANGDGIGDHNFCRNPGGTRSRPWCYTTLKRTVWEYCDVGLCPHH